MYRVGDLEFHSKLQAIEAMQKTGIHLHWDFNEAVFECYDWTKEPTESILELYKNRAQQLRDQYDYIVLLYSGGADSENVLQTFLRNDIKLDELATFVNYDATGNKNNFLNSEAFKVSIPKVKELQKQYTWLKHRIIDLTELTLRLFDDPEAKFNWIYQNNMYYTPNCIARGNLGMKVPEWVDIMNSGKKLCILYGIDKPRIYHENNRFSAKFLDILDPSVDSFAGVNPYDDEFFYWSPNSVNILIKQAHLIKNYLRNHVDTSPFISEEKSSLAFINHRGKKMWLSNHGVHSIIYPLWDINTFSAGKAPSIIISPRDDWFFSANHSTPVKNIWEMGIKKLWDQIPDYWKNNPSSFEDGFRACWSKEYYLE